MRAVGLLLWGLAVLFLWRPIARAATPTTSPHGPKLVECEKCHTAVSWRPTRKDADFDHRRTLFPLRGMHVNVRCEGCHANPDLSHVGRRCQDCHVDIHRRRNGVQCDICHRVTGWEVDVHSINEHQDRFPLIGAHAVADCFSCHKAGAIGEFNRQSLSTECVSCHLKAYEQAVAPNHRALGYSMTCQECHLSMDSWRIAGSFVPRRRR